MFTLSLKSRFQRDYRRLTRRDSSLEAKLDEVLLLLADNPRDARLKSHKVTDRNGEPAFSSEVTGDLRIIWTYGDTPNSLVLLDFGGRSGSKKVYR